MTEVSLSPTNYTKYLASQPMSKRSASSVNSSSFLNLKADLAKKKSDEKNGIQFEPDEKSKKLPAFLRPSPGVLARSFKDVDNGNQTSKKGKGKGKGKADSPAGSTSSWSSTPSAQLDAARIALERKSKMYDKLRRGKTGGLNEESIVGGLIDWDRKQGERKGNRAQGDVDASDDEDGNGNDGEIDSEEERRWRDLDDSYEDEDENEASRKKRRKDESLGEDDPLMTYKDEFGRSRTVPRSEVPREVLRAMELEAALPDESNVQYGPATSFPVYRPPSPVLQAARAEAMKDPTKHFDAEFELRDRGAGFYRFSTDEQKRREEMERLETERKETERKRMENSNRDGGEGGEEVVLDPDQKMDGASSALGPRRPLNVAEKKKKQRKELIDRKRIEIYGEQEARRLENRKIEAFLNHSLGT